MPLQIQELESHLKILINIETEGKGVGLAMIKSVLEKFNGEIWVKSKVESGSIFYFTLPETVLKPPVIKKM